MSQPLEENSTTAFQSEMAAVDFKAWPEKGAYLKIPDAEKFSQIAVPHLTAVRIAALICEKSKPELIQEARKLASHRDDRNPESLFDHLLAELRGSREWFKAFVDVLAAAEGRLMCAGAIPTDE